jgi:hypothetical protein
MLTPLSKLPPEGKAPDFPNDKLAREAIEVFSLFVDRLHSTTLRLGVSGDNSNGNITAPPSRSA